MNQHSITVKAEKYNAQGKTVARQDMTLQMLGGRLYITIQTGEARFAYYAIENGDAVVSHLNGTQV